MVKLLAVEGAGEQNLIYDECQKRNHMTNYVTAQFQSHLHVEGFFFFSKHVFEEQSFSFAS